MERVEEVNVVVVVRGGKVKRVVEVGGEEGGVEGEDELGSGGGESVCDRGEDGIGVVGGVGRVVGDVEGGVEEEGEVVLGEGGLEGVLGKGVGVDGVVVGKVEEGGVGVVEGDRVGVGGWMEGVEVGVERVGRVEEMKSGGEVGVMWKVSEGGVDGVMEMMDKDIEEEGGEK